MNKQTFSNPGSSYSCSSPKMSDEFMSENSTAQCCGIHFCVFDHQRDSSSPSAFLGVCLFTTCSWCCTCRKRAFQNLASFSLELNTGQKNMYTKMGMSLYFYLFIYWNE